MFLGILSNIQRVSISSIDISAGRLQTTGTVTATPTNINSGGAYTYKWIKSGDPCTITNENTNSTTFTGGGVVGFTQVYCDVSYSLTNVKVTSPICNITWVNTGIPITGVTWSIPGATNSTYSGLQQTVTVSSVTPAAATYTTSTTGATNAGSQASTSITGNGSYEGTFNSPILTITKRTISIASSGSTTFTYNGVSQSVGYTISGAVAQDTNYSVSGVSGTNAGSFTATLATTSNNYQLGTSTFSWSIGARTIELKSSGSTSFAWTGNAQSVGYDVSGAVSQDTDYSVSGTSGTNANNYTATLTETSSNYTLGTSTFSWSITPTAPANFTVSSVDSYYLVNFTWDAVGGSTYQLWGFDGFNWSIFENNITGTTTSYAGAVNFDYQFYVKAVAPSGTSGQSRTAFVYTGRGSYQESNPYDSGWFDQRPCCLSGSRNADIGLKSFVQGTYGVTISTVSVRNCTCNFATSLLWGTATRTVRWNLNGTAVNFPLSTSTSAPNPYVGPTSRSTTTTGTVTYVLRCSGTGWSTYNTSGLSGTFWFYADWKNIGTAVSTVPESPPTISYSS